uniref:RING-type domain-containing protein n=1 Tax=viral metagenome TaxID=1070528 RepID=A0A6C0I5B9_9ZZZZ
MQSIEGMNVNAPSFVSKEMKLLQEMIKRKEIELITLIDEDYGVLFSNKEQEQEDVDEEEDDEDVWTDIDEDEEEDEEEEEVYDCHEIIHKPLFVLPTDSDIGECVICFDAIEAVNMIITRCGHSFHASCCIASLKENNGCPLCRTQLL